MFEKLEGAHLVGCRWVYTIKYKSDGAIGAIERYKVCLVTKGFSQKYSIDYLEIFAPLIITVTRDLKLDRLDVKNTFLNGDLEEEVYIFMPSGYEKVEKCSRFPLET